MLVDLDIGQVLQARWSPSDKGLKELWIQLGGMHHFHAVFMEQRHLQNLDVNRSLELHIVRDPDDAMRP